MVTSDHPPGFHSIFTPGPRILIVEDNEAAGQGLARLLVAQGFEVRCVTDGAAAIEALNSGVFHDFLLTDLRLPDLDGRELARRMRELSPRSVVGMMTGWDIDPAIDQFENWGVDWVITKPIDFKHLLKKLAGSKPAGS